MLLRELGFEVSMADLIKSITKIASKIGINEKTIRKAIQRSDAGIVVGKNPEIIVATAIYAACVETGDVKSQITISEAAGTSTVSIRNRILEFKTKFDLFSTMNYSSGIMMKKFTVYYDKFQKMTSQKR